MAAGRRRKVARNHTGDVLGDSIDTAKLFDQLPPQNLEAERSLIGGVLLLNDVIDEITGIITSGAFYSKAHRAIWDAITDLYAADHRIDAVTLAQELQDRGQLEESGGPSYLLQCLETVPHAAHSTYYAEMIRDLWLLRKLIETSESILKDAWTNSRANDKGGAEEIVEAAESKIFALVERSQREESKTIGQVLHDFTQTILDRMERGFQGLSTGFQGLDSIIAGLAAGTLMILAARPSMGKTALVCNMAELMAEIAADGAVLLFSIEQSREELAERLLVMRARVNGHDLRTGNISAADQARLSEAYGELQNLRLIIDDNPQTVATIAAIARRWAKREKVGVIVIDYLQLVTAMDPRMPREQQISEITRRLKLMAKQLRVPVILLCQMNRAIEARQNKRPMLSDLRESGAIEQDADIVVFLHRPDYYDPGDRPGEADLIVAKNRSGPLGTAHLTWVREQMRFRDKVEGEAPGVPIAQQQIDF